MYKENTVAVVVPAFNEAGFVGEVIDTIPSFVDLVYPVDDCSTDETWAEIREHARRVNQQAADSGPVENGAGGLQSPAENGAGGLQSPAENGAGGLQSPAENGAGGLQSPDNENQLTSADAPDPTSSTESAGSDSSEPADSVSTTPRVVPLRHDENRGVGAAIKTGYRRAREDGIDVVAVMAGDGQMDPDQLPRILDPVVTGQADYAKGDRLAVEEYTDEMSNWRLFGNAVLTLLTRAASGYWAMNDPQNGYTAITSEALDRLDLDSVFDDYGFANAMLVHLNVADMRVADVPMPARYGEEDSGIRYSTFVPQLSALLAKGFAWRLTEKHLRQEVRPVSLLYALGIFGTLLGGYLTVTDTLRRDSSASKSESGRERERKSECERENECASQSNPDTDEENVANAKATRKNFQTMINTAQTERPNGFGPLTTLAGLATTALAVVFDAAENEPLHVTIESEDDPVESEDGRGSESGPEVSDR